MHTGFWCVTLNVRHPIEDLRVQVGIIVIEIITKYDERLWAGFLRTGTRCGFLLKE